MGKESQRKRASMNDRLLPIGIQSFKTIRENNYLYVDKTRHIYRMIAEGMFYFLARPRRFGKSLLVSTLSCLFQGQMELFDDLWIAQNDRWKWDAYPVVTIDFNQIDHRTPENLETDLGRSFDNCAEEFGVRIEEPFLQGRFGALIQSLRKKTGRPVVVLVDEYDKPIIDHLGRGEEGLTIAKANRDLLKNVFGVLKGADVAPALRFVFFTGVSKFSRVSIFSELNNLNDITMSRDYATLLGYTDAEFRTCFNKHIRRFADDSDGTPEAVIEGFKSTYNGYRFSKAEETVYNPFSVLQALQHRDFGHYWFETATPTFLVNLLREKEYRLPEIETLQVTETMFSTYDLDRLNAEALLFQAGYVTIKDVRGRLFTLGYPNQEVKTAFLENLYQSLAGVTNGAEAAKYALLAPYLRKEDFDAFFQTLSSLFASIPYTLESKRDEAYFHTLFYLMVSASGVDARTEVFTSRGRIDLVVEYPDKVFIIEFKCNQSADAALKQIRDMDYPQKFQGTGKQRILMGINFDTDKRNISEWKSDIIP
jgi:hypothetical protein